jgi:exodeoxyribonuclease-3
MRSIADLPGDDSDEQARFIEAVFSTESGVLRVVSLYLPNGNPVDTEKFPYKLSWMERLQAFAEDRLALEEPLVLAGDYNVIPEPVDCHDPKVWEGDALFRPESRAMPSGGSRISADRCVALRQ